MKNILIFLSLVFSSLGSFAQLTVSPLFSHHMVLQRGADTEIWGTAPAGSRVAVQLGPWQATAIAAADGQWRARMPQTTAGGPYKLVVSSKRQRQVLQNVLIGDVYLASGQSNMEWRIKDGVTARDSIRAHSTIRYAKIPRAASPEPVSAVPLQWFVAAGEEVDKCSGVAYFFAQHLVETEGVPIGIIENAVGGSPA